MSRSSKLKILFCIKILFGLFDAILADQVNFNSLNRAERRSFFGTEDASVPEFQLVNLKYPVHSTQNTFEITFSASGGVLSTTLNIVEDHNLIGRTTTGIWFAESNPKAYHNVTYTPKPEILERIGKIDYFQNLNDGSAVTRYTDSSGRKTYYGILKRNYTVKSVPQHLKSGLPLVIFKSPEVSQEQFMPRVEENHGLQRRRRETEKPTDSPNVVYPKVIISPDYRMISHHLTIDDFVKHMIADLNAVDMLYRQLRDPEVWLHVAGVIIPKDEFATPYIQPKTINKVSLIPPDMLHLPNAYFLEEEQRFPFHSYDVLVVITTAPMFDYDKLGNIELFDGGAFLGSACGRVNKKIGGAAIMQFAGDFKAVWTLAHDLGIVFGAYNDGQGTSAKCPNEEGYIMTSKINFLKKLEWSTCSKRAISVFLRSEDATCLRNRPHEKIDAVKSI